MKALVIAGGLPQIELIKQLKDRGIEALLADGSPNAVARSFCDKFFHVDVFNMEAIKDIALAEKVDFLITVCAEQDRKPRDDTIRNTCDSMPEKRMQHPSGKRRLSEQKEQPHSATDHEYIGKHVA